MAAIRKSKVVEAFWWLHPWVYRATGGRVLGRVQGMPVLLLTTTGRRSGRPRTTALTYLPEGDACLVVASFLGEPRHPGWFHNLRAQPRASIQIGAEQLDVSAREAEGAERDQLWKQVIAHEPSYVEYTRRTSRRIPLVVLDPVRGDA